MNDNMVELYDFSLLRRFFEKSREDVMPVVMIDQGRLAYDLVFVNKEAMTLNLESGCTALWSIKQDKLIIMKKNEKLERFSYWAIHYQPSEGRKVIFLR